MEEFLTPESSAYPDQMRTPGTVSTAQRSSLPTSAGSGDASMTSASATSGKKRPAAPSSDDDDSDDSMDNNTSFFGRIVSSVTPWRRKNKRARSSLDSMSGSAIKSASRLPASEDSDRSNNGGDSAKKASLGKLNLEHKFHETPAPATNGTVAAATAAAAMPVQTLNGQQTANNNNNEGNVAAKRVRVADDTVTTANGNSNIGIEGAVKAVRIGGTTFVSSDTTTNNRNSVTFQDHATTTMPEFNIGSSTTKLKDVRGRNATPARGGRSKTWGTPSAGVAAARYGTKYTLPQDGIATTSNKGVGYQRRSIGSLSTPSSRGGAFRRRAINARKYKPMSNILSRIHSDTATNNGRNGAATGQSKQSLFLSNSIADQILRDTQNKLFQKTASSGVNHQEVTLFGVASSDNQNNGARTFEEEAAQYKAVTNKGSAAVPRVRMTRMYGTGQLGGRTPLESASSTATTTAIAAAASGMTASISLQPSIAGKSMPSAATSVSAPSASKRIAAVPEANAKDVTFSGSETTFVPFNVDPIPARGKGKTQFTPCKADENLSQQMSEEINQMVSTDEWKRKAAECDQFGDVGEATIPKKKSKGTPHPKTAGGSSAKPVSEAAGRVPFDFMPGGGAASSKVDTPMAFAYGKNSDVPQSSSPAVVKPPTKANVPVATDTNTSSTSTSTSLGWGNLFADQSQQWKCNVCTTQNPLDKTKCLSCETPKDGTDSKSDATPSSNKADSTKKASVGTGGFTFSASASASTPAPAPAAASAGSIGAGGFSFSGSSNASAGTPSIKFGVTPSKATEQKEGDDAKPGTKSGFSFPGATPAKSKPSAGGFSFGGTSSTPSSKTEGNTSGSEDKKDDTSKGNTGFKFGASASSSSTSSNNNASFSFSQTSTSSGADDENKGDTANTPAFNFGSTSSDPKPKRGRSGEEENEKQGGGKKIASVAAGFAFGSNANENKSTPTTSLAFGAASKKDDAAKGQAPATTFAFGAKTLEQKADNATTSFAFGSTPADSEKKTPAASSGFSFGQASASSGATSTTAEKKENPFAFGQPATSTPAPEKENSSTTTSAPAFAFGAAASSDATKAPTPAAPFQFGSQAPAENKENSFAFGQAATSTPATEKKDIPASAPAPAFAFGAAASSDISKAPTPAAPFQFGSQAPAAAPPAAAGPPAFGGSGFGMTQTAAPQPAVPAPAFGFGAAAQTPAPAPAFGFGGSAQTAPAPAANTGFAFGSNPTTSTAPAPAFGMPPAATPAATPAPAFGSGFGGTQAPAPAMNGGAGSGGFNIGTGGGAKKTPGRRIVRARRPPGSGR